VVSNLTARICVLLTLLSGGVYAEVKVSVVPDNGTALYCAGETVSWNIELENHGVPFNGPMEYTVKAGGLKIIQNGTVDFKEGKATVSATMDRPGTLLMNLLPDSLGLKQNEKQLRKMAGGAVFSAEKIEPSGDEPADFDAFWASKLAELAAVPMNAQLEKVEHAEVDLWKISMDNIRGTRICGHIARPKNSTGKLPACANFEGAGVRGANPKTVVNQAKNGWLSMNIIAHSIEAYREPEFYQKLAKGELQGYPTFGKEDRETCYFLRMLLATSRCVDYLSQRPEWDGTVLRVNGGSQGGWQSIAAAALNSKVTLVTANVSAGCDHTGHLNGRDSGWPKEAWHEESSRRTFSYYDNVFFARRITCPAVIGAGAIDPVCAPVGICAMYNQLAGPKRLVVMPEGEHGGVGHQPWWNVLGPAELIMRQGKPFPGIK